AARAFAYLRRLQNLDEWTLGSRMTTRIDDDTWMGTASGYQAMLCYHVRTLEHPRLGAIEWQCGYRYREYFKQYPVFVFPSRYADPYGDEDGSYVHWISVIDPARRTEMIMQGIAAVHHYEARALKATLERGLPRPAVGRMSVLSDTMWVDAPIEMARALLADQDALPSWAPHYRAGPSGEFVDEYARRVEVEFKDCALGDYVLVEQDYAYLDLGEVQRCPVILIPSARAFGPDAPGFLLHRVAFVRSDGSHTFGRTSAADLTAESMAIKRMLEARAGNGASFARGMSYRPQAVVHEVAASPPEIFSPEFAADPYPLYRRMRDEYPLYFHAPTQAWILSRYDDVRLALHDPAFTTKSYAAQTEPLLGKTLVQLDGREHSLQRGLLTPSFTERSIQERFSELIHSAIDELTGTIAARGEADLIGDVVVHLPVRIMAGLLGLPLHDRDRFRIWYTALIQGALNLTGDPAVAAAGIGARDELDAYLRPLIAERRAHPGTDLISMLATTTVEGERLTDEQIIRFAMLMVFAGGETTEKGLATTLRNLLAHPDALAEVRADRSLLPRAIAESFRFTAPTHMVPRQTNAEVAVSGGILPAGAEVICFLGSANRDERRFADPDRFDLHRPESDPARAFTGAAAHLAFGGGRHFCLGAVLSRFEIEVALSRILDAFPDLRLEGDAPADVGLSLRGPATLPVRFRVPTGTIR
ncbi:MAG: cytochrome P450, partial [Candidatus Eisenbacteria bacterium]